MRALVQWTLAAPQDWLSVDPGATPTAWSSLDSKSEPTGGESMDDAPGWVYAVNVQGVIFSGYDHYALSPLPDDGLEVTVWNDDPAESPPGTREAQVWTFLPLASDARFDGALNTRQSRVVYTERAWPDVPESTTVLPWSEFTPPPASLVRHGIWVTDALAEVHRASQSRQGWRDWA